MRQADRPEMPLPPKPKKSLGQNFLVNQGICERIVKLLPLAPESLVLEIGPGAGALTKYLAQAPHAALLLLEKDRELAKTLGVLADGKTDIVNADAMKFDWSRLNSLGVWNICGNLPYNVASPLIWDILAKASYAKTVFMVQKEVAQRFAAKPGTGAYGALTVWAGCHARPRLEFTVAPGNFRPMPKVDSAVVSFTPLPVDQWPQNPRALKKLLDLCFQNRRKQLGGIFRKHGQQSLLQALEELGLAPSLRPENLSCQDYMNLAGAIS